MKIADSKEPVAGANRGLEEAAVEEALHRPPDWNWSCTCKRYL
jgi:hypothetical protein